ncbi:DUF3592 domain-containing protein [Rhodocytophaga rosea]|uniref:DUF3592 domain-containing protein n=1 Tax=Rhodocytophaga rosea TaxID=2704465 RepID=UPI00374466FA
MVDNKQEREPKGDVNSNLLQILACKYQIDGIENASSIKFNYENFLGLSRWVSNYGKGDEVDILYNPDNPQEITL